MKTGIVLWLLFTITVTARKPPFCPEGSVPCRNTCCRGACQNDIPCCGLVCVTEGFSGCCAEGSECIDHRCCPKSYVVDGECCPPSSETCCVTGTPSRCYNDGYQSCVKNKWVFTVCTPPTFCAPFPVAGAGVSCVGPPGGGKRWAGVQIELWVVFCLFCISRSAS